MHVRYVIITSKLNSDSYKSIQFEELTIMLPTIFGMNLKKSMQDVCNQRYTSATCRRKQNVTHRRLPNFCDAFIFKLQNVHKRLIYLFYWYCTEFFHWFKTRTCNLMRLKLGPQLLHCGPAMKTKITDSVSLAWQCSRLKIGWRCNDINFAKGEYFFLDFYQTSFLIGINAVHKCYVSETHVRW